MIYEVTVRIDYNQYLTLDLSLKRVKAIYKQKPDGRDTEWIRDNSELITGGSIAAYVYDLYFDYFAEEPVLSKTKFYKACREVLSVEMKMIRIEDKTKYCFYKKTS